MGEHMRRLMSRRTFAKLSTAGTGAAAAHLLTTGVAASAVTTGVVDEAVRTLDGESSARQADDDKLQSEFLLDLVLETGPANNVGSLGVTRVVVPVSSGTFEGPKLKGTVIGPSGDWIVGRPDGTAVLDVRMMLQTDDAQKIYMTWRGISYTPPGGTQYARIALLFETGAAKYVWLNHLVAVGVHRSMPGKVAYRVYQIL
jgi:hypothetical protein